MSTSKALAIIGNGKKTPDEKAEKIDKPPAEKITPPTETLYVHSALLLAAESVAAKDASRPWLAGVYLHRREKVARVVGADGARLFIGSFPIEGKSPTWLTSGVIMEAEGLRKRTQIIMAMQDSPLIKLTHTKGNGFIEMSDTAGDAVFKIPRVALDYAPYEKVLGADSFSLLDEEGNIRGREWEPVGINSKYLKSCGDIAKTLEAGMPKEKRAKTGMVVRAYNGSNEAPLVFDFLGWPGAVLVMSPVKMSDASIPKETAMLMAPAVKLTLAALRAHATRNLAWAEAATNPAIKAEHEAKAAGFVERIGKILAATSSLPKIAADYEAEKAPIPMPPPDDWMTPRSTFESTVTEPAAAPEPEPTPEPIPEPEPDQPIETTAEQPIKVTRTRIKVRKTAA